MTRISLQHAAMLSQVFCGVTAALPGLTRCVRVAVIVEATYGVSQHEPRQEREQRFLARLRQVVGRGGRVLLPVVALGRAQVP